MRIKNVSQDESDHIRPEYDLSQLKGGVRGKYFKRATAGTTLVLLDPDVAEAFPDAKTLNQALRALAKIARNQAKAIRTATELPDTTVRPPSRAQRKSKPDKISRAARG